VDTRKIQPDVIAIPPEGQRLLLAFLLALAVHVVLLFGIRFTLLSAPPVEPVSSVQLSWLPPGIGRGDIVSQADSGASPAPTEDNSGVSPAPTEDNSGASPAPPPSEEAGPAAVATQAAEAIPEPAEAAVPQAAEPAPAVTARQAPPANPAPKPALPLRHKAEAAPSAPPPARPVPRQAEKKTTGRLSPAPAEESSSRQESSGMKSTSQSPLPRPAPAAMEKAPAAAGSARAAATGPVPGKSKTSRPGGLELLEQGLEIARNTTTAERQGGDSWEKNSDNQSLSTLKNFYEENWARKVERMGSIPAEASRLNLSTGPTLAATIRADGSVQSITVLRSSGHAAIDQAARRMVEAAAPYAPFPPELRRQTSTLRIVRKWKFEHGRMLSD